jgi:SGNH domain (fused to AT3 domains)
LVGFGLLIVYSNGLPGRFDADSLRVLAGATDFNRDREQCLAADVARIKVGQFCALGDATGKTPQFVLWGDSQAEAIRAGIGEAAADQRQAGLFAGAEGCAPLIGVERPDISDCRSVNEAVLDWIRSTPAITTVILAGRWAIWAEGVRYKREDRLPHFIPVSSPSHQGETIQNNGEAFSEGLESTVSALSKAGKSVWLVGPVPEIGFDVPRSLYNNALRFNRQFDIRPTTNEFMERQKKVFAAFAGVEKRFPVKIVWPHRPLCDDERCAVQKEGLPLYSDDNHLTTFGEKQLVRTFLPIFQ